MGRCPRGERAGGEGDILILFPHCHPERSEGSHCPTTSKHKKRYLATRALVLIVPNHTGALLGMTRRGVWVRSLARPAGFLLSLVHTAKRIGKNAYPISWWS